VSGPVASFRDWLASAAGISTAVASLVVVGAVFVAVVAVITCLRSLAGRWRSNVNREWIRAQGYAGQAEIDGTRRARRQADRAARRYQRAAGRAR
jgi:hypothetical protein